MWKPFVLVLVVAACGDDAPSAPDAPTTPDAPPTGGTDPLACTPRGAAGAITVDGPSGASIVVAHDHAGAVVGRSGLIAANATATIDAPSCGWISVHDTDDKSNTSWANVQPGDHLVHPTHQSASVAHAIQLDVTAFAGAVSYEAMAACSGSGLPLTQTVAVGASSFDAMCAPGSTSVSVVVIATTASGTAGIALSSDTPLAASGPTTVAMPAYQPSTQLIAASVANLGPFSGGDGLFGLLALPLANRPVVIGQRITTLGSPDLGSIAAVAGAGGVALLSVRTPSTASSDRVLGISRPYAAFPPAIVLDRTTDLLPTVTASFADRSVTWSTERAATAGLASVVIEAGTTRWTVVVPATPGTFALPTLPSDLLPAAALRLAGVTITDASTITSYDDARAHLALFQYPPPATDELRSSGVFFRAP